MRQSLGYVIKPANGVYYRSRTSFIQENNQNASSISFFLSHDYLVPIDPPLDTLSMGFSHVAARISFFLSHDYLVPIDPPLDTLSMGFSHVAAQVILV